MTSTRKASRAGSGLVGREAEIKGGYYAGHWGFVRAFDGQRYVISGGSIGSTSPVFDRDEFIIRVPKKARRDDY